MNIHHNQNFLYKNLFQKSKRQATPKKMKTKLPFPGWRQKRRLLGSRSISGENEGEGLGRMGKEAMGGM